MNIYIVRHGQTDCNKKKIVQGWLDSELNNSGIQQAENIADELSGILFDAVYCSDLKRAQSTAKIITKNLSDYSGKIILDTRLRERCLGDLEGTSSENLDNSIYFSDNPELHFESMSNFRQRVLNFLNDLSSKESFRNVLIVTHNGTMNIFEELLGARNKKSFRKNGEIVKIEINELASYLLLAA